MSDTVFRREIGSRRQWGYGTCYGGSFPAAKECTEKRKHSHQQSALWSIGQLALNFGVRYVFIRGQIVLYMSRLFSYMSIIYRELL